MKRVMTTLVLLTCAISPAKAARHWYNVQARPIVEGGITLYGNGTFTFETDDLKSSTVACPQAADTKIVVRDPDGFFYYNDDYSLFIKQKIFGHGLEYVRRRLDVVGVWRVCI
jgi:hypothetical protein